MGIRQEAIINSQRAVGKTYTPIYIYIYIDLCHVSNVDNYMYVCMYVRTYVCMYVT